MSLSCTSKPRFGGRSAMQANRVAPACDTHHLSVRRVGGSAALDIPVYFMGWRNLSINHVCSIKLLSHCLNYSSTMFNLPGRVEPANSHTKRIFLFVSVLALISNMLHYFSGVLIFSLIHIFMLYHVAQNNKRVFSYIGETGKKTQIN